VVKGYNLEPVRSVYEYPVGALLHVPEINDEVERELSSISKDCYSSGCICVVEVRVSSGILY
jgi:glycine cleavage system H lipoate-binding protein